MSVIYLALQCGRVWLLSFGCHEGKRSSFTYYTFFRNGKPVDAEEMVLAAILLPESEFSRGGSEGGSSCYC